MSVVCTVEMANYQETSTIKVEVDQCVVCREEFIDSTIECILDGCAKPHRTCIACVVRLPQDECAVCRKPFTKITPVGCKRVLTTQAASRISLDARQARDLAKMIVFILFLYLMVGSPIVMLIAGLCFLLQLTRPEEER